MARKKVEEETTAAVEKVEEPKESEPVKVAAPTDEQIERLKAEIADASAKVAKGKAIVALAEPRIEHLAGVVDRIREASTAEKQAARFEEAEKMLKGLFKED